MSSHIGRTYLNSCVKVPIDPCNNCPAPFFNRPKMYLGRLSATPNICNRIVRKHCNEANYETKWSCDGIRSLAKLYDIIPDYKDLHHLSGEEFYKTLKSLRSTCRELEVKTSCYKPEDQSSTSTTSSSLVASCTTLAEGQSKKRKKKKSKSSTKCHEFAQQTSKNKKSLKEIVADIPKVKSCSSSHSKSPQMILDKEVEMLKKSIDEFEAEFKPPSTSLNREESRPNTRYSSKEYENKSSNCDKPPVEKLPALNTSTLTLRERLRKSLSFNDLPILAESPALEEFRKQNKTSNSLSHKGEGSFFKSNQNCSNYFKENFKSEETKIPKIVVDSPEIENSKKQLSKNEDYKMALKICDLETSTKDRNIRHSTPSPIHPVARPNLAATLRAESSKRKVQELKTNCTFHDTTAQFDWEVRKTPAWKTLSLNETHKQILKLRLATRKAEQALQQREYELNMELMRQRVKSAPLLLEGPTHFGPHVGKLTHSCQKEGRRHLCQRTKRKSHASRGHSCRRRLFSNASILEDDIFDNPANTFRVQVSSGNEKKHKMNEFCKIYGRGNHIAKPQSRSSNRSTTTQTSFKSQRRAKSKNAHKKLLKTDADFEAVEIDSGEELSSLDRAFL